jgi:hypothetical protein
MHNNLGYRLRSITPGVEEAGAVAAGANPVTDVPFVTGAADGVGRGSNERELGTVIGTATGTIGGIGFTPGMSLFTLFAKAVFTGMGMLFMKPRDVNVSIKEVVLAFSIGFMFTPKLGPVFIIFGII